MRVLIIEDEKRAANQIKRILNSIDSSIIIVEVISSVQEGILFLNENPEPDLILSDIQLNDGISFEIFEKTTISCPIIFTTAYNQYAIQAFKVNGIDYLLKPIDPDELNGAIKKYKIQFASNNDIPTRESLILAMSQALNQTHYKSRFMIKVGTKIKSIETVEISCFYSHNKATYLLTESGRSFDIDYSIESLKEIIDPNKFFQISRKYFVSINGIKEITAWSNSRLKLLIKGSNDLDIIVARERTKEFKSWLDS